MTTDESREAAASLQGRVVRAWREHAQLTGAELSRRLHVTPAALANWERGLRRANPRDVATLGANLGLPLPQVTAFEDMWAAAPAVTDGMPRQGWDHNYLGPSTPVWIWVRPASGDDHIGGTAWWGEPFQGSIDRIGGDIGAAGLIVHAPVSLGNPALRISLNSAGWVNFGRGVIPEEVALKLGIRLCDYRLITGTSASHGAARIEHEDERAIVPLLGYVREWGERIGTGWHLLAPHIKMVRSRRAPHALDGATLTTPPWTSATAIDPLQAVVTLVSAEQLQQIRKSRGLSREAAARAATELDSRHEVTPRMIEIVEKSGTPSSPQLISRLDMVYAADGRLGVEQVFDSRQTIGGGTRSKSFVIKFFPYWVGPVWVRAVSPEETTGLVELTWGPWRRKQTVRSGSILTTRKASADAGPLHIRVPLGWSVTAGVGASPTALDINEAWWPVNIRAAKRILIDSLRHMS